MTTTLQTTEHAVMRMAQRGVPERSIELILSIATEVKGGFLVRQKDFATFDQDLKRLRDELRRLVGKRLVVEGSQVITVYHATNEKEQMLLRGGAVPRRPRRRSGRYR